MPPKSPQTRFRRMLYLLSDGPADSVASPTCYNSTNKRFILQTVFLLLFVIVSCIRCTCQCCPAAARLQSAWRPSCCWEPPETPPWSARSCRCWRSSGRFLVGPDTPQRAVPGSLSDSCLMTSETGRRPRHLHLCAAVTGNDISPTLSSISWLCVHTAAALFSHAKTLTKGWRF